MKVFRVVFVLSCLLALVTLCKVGMRETWGQRLIMVVLLVGASALLLYLWSQESRHYYRKVYHAYEIVFPGASATAFIPSDTYYEENKDAAIILQAIVKLQDQGKDDSEWQAALAAPGGDTLLRFDFYRCMLKACKDPEWKAPALTAKQRNAWLLHWRNSLNATSALDARIAGLIAVAERYSFPNQPNQPSSGENKKAKKDRKLNSGGESLSAASGASKR